MSLFDSLLVVAGLTALLFLSYLIAAVVRRTRISKYFVIANLTCLLLVAVLGYGLYLLAERPLSDNWYEDVLADEPIDKGRVYLGRVLGETVSECDIGKTCYDVKLDTGAIQVIPVDQDVFGEFSEIVLVTEFVGRYSGKRDLFITNYVPVHDASYFWSLNGSP